MCMNLVREFMRGLSFIVRYSCKKPEGPNIKRPKRNDLLQSYKARAETGNDIVVEVRHLYIGVCFQIGDEVIKDVNCDSEYMLKIMPKVGKAI